MDQHFMNVQRLFSRAAACALAAIAMSALGSAQAAVPGITGAAATPVFNIDASAEYITQPDGQMIYSWGYGCTTAPSGFLPAAMAATAKCPLMQIPGPTMIVTEGDSVTVVLTNSLPAAAGNTSIVFGGIAATATGGVPGVTTAEAAPGGNVTYTFTAGKPGTYAYYSGTQSDLQVEMGLYGALVVLPKAPVSGTACTNRVVTSTLANALSLSSSAYDHPETCYDREYLFQFAEMNSDIHRQVEMQANGPGPISAQIEPYQPNYFLINGRSMPDIMDVPYGPQYPHQPYNGNPHMHPGDLVLMRTIGQGRWQHPFHFHGNHARVLARDGNLMLAMGDTQVPPRLAGPLLFTTPTVSGQTQDAIFTWTGKGLNWDVYGHVAGDGSVCVPDANGYYTSNPSAPNYGEYCADHLKPIPVTPPDPQIVANGLWYGGSPYLGLNTSVFTSTPLPPGIATQNNSAGYAYMWHSHNEREITTNDVFPGGMMMMLIIDPPSATIDETQ